MKTLEEKQRASKWFGDDALWFVIFVRTKDEREVVDKLNGFLKSERYIAFIPTRDYVYRKGKNAPEIQHSAWIKGYVFVASVDDAEKCKAKLHEFVKKENNVYRVLGYDGGLTSAEMTGADKRLMTTLLDVDFNIPALAVVQAGDKVRLVDEVFEDVEGKVLKFNKKKLMATIEIAFMGRRTELECAVDYMEIIKDYKKALAEVEGKRANELMGRT